MNPMDPLRSGAIFNLKPHKVLSQQPSTRNEGFAVPSLPVQSHTHDQTFTSTNKSFLKENFERLYRATPLPPMLNASKLGVPSMAFQAIDTELAVSYNQHSRSSSSRLQDMDEYANQRNGKKQNRPSISSLEFDQSQIRPARSVLPSATRNRPDPEISQPQNTRMNPQVYQFLQSNVPPQSSSNQYTSPQHPVNIDYDQNQVYVMNHNNPSNNYIQAPTQVLSPQQYVMSQVPSHPMYVTSPMMQTHGGLVQYTMHTSPPPPPLQQQQQQQQPAQQQQQQYYEVQQIRGYATPLPRPSYSIYHQQPPLSHHQQEYTHPMTVTMTDQNNNTYIQHLSPPAPTPAPGMTQHISPQQQHQVIKVVSMMNHPLPASEEDPSGEEVYQDTTVVQDAEPVYDMEINDTVDIYADMSPSTNTSYTPDHHVLQHPTMHSPPVVQSNMMVHHSPPAPITTTQDGGVVPAAGKGRSRRAMFQSNGMDSLLQGVLDTGTIAPAPVAATTTTNHAPPPPIVPSRQLQLQTPHKAMIESYQTPGKAAVAAAGPPAHQNMQSTPHQNQNQKSSSSSAMKTPVSNHHLASAAPSSSSSSSTKITPSTAQKQLQATAAAPLSSSSTHIGTPKVYPRVPSEESEFTAHEYEPVEEEEHAQEQEKVMYPSSAKKLLQSSGGRTMNHDARSAEKQHRKSQEAAALEMEMEMEEEPSSDITNSSVQYDTSSDQPHPSFLNNNNKVSKSKNLSTTRSGRVSKPVDRGVPGLKQHKNNKAKRVSSIYSPQYFTIGDDDEFDRDDLGEHEDDEDYDEQEGNNNNSSERLQEIFFPSSSKKALAARTSSSTAPAQPQTIPGNRKPKPTTNAAANKLPGKSSKTTNGHNNITGNNNSIGDLSKQLLQLSQTPPKQTFSSMTHTTTAASSSSSAKMTGGQHAMTTAVTARYGNGNTAMSGRERETEHEQRMSEPANSHPWTPVELVGLYGIHGKTDLTQPNFWELISSQLKDRGIHRTSEECEYRWFLAVEDAQKRTEKNTMKKKGLQLKQTLSKLQEITSQQQPSYLQQPSGSTSQQPQSQQPQPGDGGNSGKRRKKEEEEEEVDGEGEDEEGGMDGDGKKDSKPKRRRIGNNDLKLLAEQSSKAVEEDDLFHSQSFLSRKPKVTSSSLRLQEEDLPDFLSSPSDSNLTARSVQSMSQYSTSNSAFPRLRLDTTNNNPRKSVSAPVTSTGTASFFARAVHGPQGGMNGMNGQEEEQSLFQSKHVHKIHRNRIKPQLIAPVSSKTTTNTTQGGGRGSGGGGGSSSGKKSSQQKNASSTNNNVYHFMHEVSTSLKKVQEEYQQDTEDEMEHVGVLPPGAMSGDEEDEDEEDEDEE